MKHLTLVASFLLAALPGTARPPNILFILTDDLGYGDLGVYFQNERAQAGQRDQPWFATPHLDRMAGEGMRLTHHYCAAPVCAPSRASLLLGVHQGHANVRDNQFDKALEDNHTLGTVLRQAGYATAAIGKWGLQGPGFASEQPGHPLRRGFDYFYGLLAHISGHFHYLKEHGSLDNQGQPTGVHENHRNVTDGLDQCYSTDLFTSDNGPHHEGGYGGRVVYDPTFFESFGPLQGIKRDCWEGGVRVPTLAWWPGHIPSGAVDVEQSGFWDWLPTFADLAGIPAPCRSDGVSLVPTLTGRGPRAGP